MTNVTTVQIPLKSKRQIEKSSVQKNGRKWLPPILKSKRVKMISRLVMLFGMLSYLIYKLSRIGWGEILGSLPASPLFYGLSFIALMAPILADKLAFNSLTANKIHMPMRIFMRKHVMNKAILTYSGEAYLIERLSKLGKLSLGKATIIIKDMALVRTFVANFWIIILVLITLALGNVETLTKITATSPLLILSVGFICFFVPVAAVLFFRKLTRMSYSMGAKITGLFLIRSAVVALVLVTQWNLAIPGTALSVWFTFLVVYLLTRKSPVGGELVFISVALTLSGLHADEAAVAAMLVTILALNQVNYVIAFLMSLELPQKCNCPRNLTPNLA